METTRIYIADDHQIVIDGIELLLDSESDLQIVGTGTHGDRVYADLERLKPDIAILDIRMPGKDGLQIVQQLHTKIGTKFIMLTMQMDKRVVVDAQHNGASGFLLKNSGKEELLTCVRAVMRGESYFHKISIPVKDNILSPREMDILRLVLDGLTSNQISEQLHLSHYTVETHRKNICRKTDCNNVATLLKYAIANGLYTE
jgi:DNA-binding NarL/FixJ family response regulator